jgi:hypothetical protein
MPAVAFEPLHVEIGLNGLPDDVSALGQPNGLDADQRESGLNPRDDHCEGRQRYRREAPDRAVDLGLSVAYAEVHGFTLKSGRLA